MYFWDHNALFCAWTVCFIFKAFQMKGNFKAFNIYTLYKEQSLKTT